MNSTTRRFSVIVDVHLVLRRGGEILLGERTNTGYYDGAWHMVSGHLEPGESVVAALIREAKEEVGINIDPSDVVPVAAWHTFLRCASGAVGRPTNQEPDKCAGLEWFGFDGLPDEMIPYARYALERYQKGEGFSVYGWGA